MKFTHREILLLLILLMNMTCHAQSPFGKKFAVLGRQGISLTGTSSVGLISHSRIELAYNVSKSFMLGIEGSTAIGKLKGYENLNEWAENPSIRDLAVGLRFYYFREEIGSRTPMGRYFIVGLNFGIRNKFHVETFTAPTSNSSGFFEYDLYYMNKERVAPSMVLTAGFGRNFIFNERLLFGYNCDFGYQVLLNNDPFSFRYFMLPSILLGYTF